MRCQRREFVVGTFEWQTAILRKNCRHTITEFHMRIQAGPDSGAADRQFTQCR